MRRKATSSSLRYLTRNLLFTLTLLLAGVSPTPCDAQHVYRWEDASGKVHYSSKPPRKNAKPAELPQIMRAEVKLPKVAAVSCETHGGINCQSGSDADGSVICFDGFRDASTRFQFACSAAKLEISDISEVGLDGDFSVFVRNAKSVVAQQPTATFRILSKTGEKIEVPLVGPSSIDAFGIAEFTFSGKTGDPRLAALALSAKPEKKQFQIGCANCDS
jgi:hypothetical protein